MFKNNSFYQAHQDEINEILDTALRDYQQWFNTDDVDDTITYQAIETQLDTKLPIENEYVYDAVANYRQYLDDVLSEPEAKTNPDAYADDRSQKQLLDQIVNNVLN